MRIGMFTDSYKPYMSGVTNSVVLYKEYLERQGHEVLVFTYGHRDEPTETGVFRSPGFGWPGLGYQLGYPVTREVRDAARTIDIAHVHQPFLSGLQAWRLSAEGTRFPLVFTCHSRYHDQAREYAWAIPAPLRERWLRRYLRWFTGRASATIVPSTSNREWLASIGISDGVILLPNAIETERFETAAAARRFPEPGEPFRYCYSGRLAPEKSLDVVLAAFAEVSRRSDARLALVGDGPECDDLRRKAAELGISGAVEFRGAVGYEWMPLALAEQHCFVTASLSEVLPLSLIEGTAAGLPIVAADGPGMRDVIDAESTGLLTAHDPSALAEAMLRVQDRPLWERMSESATERGRQFSIECLGTRMVELYASVVASYGGGESG